MASAVNLNKRLTIQRQSTTQDSVGQLVDTWTSTATVWGSIKPVSGRNYFTASGERAEVTHTIAIRHGVTVAVRDRITHGSRTFRIRSVINADESHRYLHLMCTEQVT